MNGSFLIPQQFKLNSHIIKVVIDNDYCNEEYLLGEADFTEKIIKLASTNAGKKISKKEKELTYYHELVHMILDAMGKERLKYDENFVEDFSRLLYEYEKTKQ